MEKDSCMNNKSGDIKMVDKSDDAQSLGYLVSLKGALAGALAKAQGEMQNAARDSENPFFKSTYADLTSVWDACRGPLSKNGLSITQTFENSPEGKLMLRTTLLHVSGGSVSSLLPIVPVKNDPQGVGSAITYMRRFSLSALVGIAPGDDDDGNAANGNEGKGPNGKQAPRGKEGPIKPPVIPPAEDPAIKANSMTERRERYTFASQLWKSWQVLGRDEEHLKSAVASSFGEGRDLKSLTMIELGIFASHIKDAAELDNKNASEFEAFNKTSVDSNNIKRDN